MIDIEKQSEEYKNKLVQEHYAYYLLDFAKMCFQDGAKWGMEHQWHDLRKNPNDLPKEKELVLLLICAGVRVIGWYNDNRFIMDVNGRMFDKEDIIAWCELPTFKE